MFIATGERISYPLLVCSLWHHIPFVLQGGVFRSLLYTTFSSFFTHSLRIKPDLLLIWPALTCHLPPACLTHSILATLTFHLSFRYTNFTPISRLKDIISFASKALHPDFHRTVSFLFSFQFKHHVLTEDPLGHHCLPPLHYPLSYNFTLTSS